jgi:FAD-dependent urate hydroxylase
LKAIDSFTSFPREFVVQYENLQGFVRSTRQIAINQSLQPKILRSNVSDCDVTVVGAGPYGMSAAAYLKSAGVQTRVFGDPMSFWENRMPAGMFLRSNWGASHIADPDKKMTLDAYSLATSNHLSAPIPLNRFVDYGRWYQRQLIPEVEKRNVTDIQALSQGFQLTLADGEKVTSRRVVVAAGIGNFLWRPSTFDAIPSELVTHSSEHRDFGRFKGCRVAVIGGGQSALESAALLHEAGADTEVIARRSALNWVGIHYRLHHLGPISWVLYSDRDVGPAGLSRIVSVPHLFRLLPREVQDRAAQRAIRPAGSGWLRPRLSGVPITLGREVASAAPVASRLRLTLDDGAERLVDHAILATGFRVDLSRYEFLPRPLQIKLRTENGYPVLGRGLESSIPGLHFLGKPAAWSFGPLLGFVSGAQFAANELVDFVAGKNDRKKQIGK